jgi:hypothetical protein
MVLNALFVFKYVLNLSRLLVGTTSVSCVKRDFSNKTTHRALCAESISIKNFNLRLIGNYRSK